MVATVILLKRLHCRAARIIHSLPKDMTSETLLWNCNCNWNCNSINRYCSSRSEVYKFVAWGSSEDCLGRSNRDLPIYISMVSAQLPNNKTKSRPLTVAHSHISWGCFFISCLLRCVHLRAEMFIHRL